MTQDNKLIQTYLENTLTLQDTYGENALILIQIGIYFDCFGLRDRNTQMITGSCIESLSKICDLKISEKPNAKPIGSKNIIRVGFALKDLEKNVQKMNDQGYTVQIQEQYETTPGKFERKITWTYSPGAPMSLNEDIQQISNNTLCVWIQVIDNKSSIMKRATKIEEDQIVQVGYSNINIFTGETCLFQYQQPYLTNATTFDELERFVSMYPPTEAILISNVSETEIEEIQQYANIHCSTIHRLSFQHIHQRTILEKCEKQIYQHQILETFYPHIHGCYQHFLEQFQGNTIALQSFCYLLDFMFQHNPALVNRIHEPILENISDRVILANHTLKQLNIVNDFNCEGMGMYSSIEKMLNQCLTPMGRRRFSYLLLHPTTNEINLQREYNITEHMISLIHPISSTNLQPLASINKFSRNYVMKQLSNIKDIHKFIRQLIMKRVSPKMISTFYGNIQLIREWYDIIKDDTLLIEYIQFHLQERKMNFFSIPDDCQQIITFLDTSLDLSLCNELENCHQFETPFIKKGFDSLLDQRTEQWMDSFDQLQAIQHFFNDLLLTMEKISIKKNGYQSIDFVKLNETDKFQMTLTATKRRCLLLQEAIKKKNILYHTTYHVIDYISSSTKQMKSFTFNCTDPLQFENGKGDNETLITPQIKQLCERICNTKKDIKDIISRLYSDTVLYRLTKDYQHAIETFGEFITWIDVIYTRSWMACKYNYCKPTIVSSKQSISGFTMKGLRHALIENIQKQTSIYIPNDVSMRQQRGLLLYGTNQVGKTSLMRAIGIAIILAQSGMYVPCLEMEYTPFRSLFTRIIGNDNLFKGLSTFAVEMCELRTIIQNANESSLILGDELCSGTESTSAKTIFMAGIITLCQKQSCFLFATHLHEILQYEELKQLLQIGKEQIQIKHMEVIYNREKKILEYIRKLQDGNGSSVYGLEVLQSMSFPKTFMELCHQLRLNYHPESNSMLSLNSSHFNRNKLRTLCEKCGEHMSEEIHHIQPQKNANKDGFIQQEDGTIFHKNHPENLMALCGKCHLLQHHSTVLENVDNDVLLMESIPKKKKKKTIS